MFVAALPTQFTVYLSSILLGLGVLLLLFVFVYLVTLNRRQEALFERLDIVERQIRELKGFPKSDDSDV